MKNNDNAIRVAVICDNGALQQQIQASLDSQPEFQYLDTFGLSDRLIRDLRALYPEVILIDYKVGGEPTLDMIDDLQLQFPDARIVAILPNQDPIMAQQVMLAGAQAFMVQPFTQINLQSTVRRVHDLKLRHTSVRGTPEKLTDSIRPVKIISVFSPRGGTGCSSVAANLALAIFEATNKRVLLFEGKLFFGHLDILLNIRAQNNLADLLPHASSIDEGLVRDVISVHVSGIHVLVGPSNMQVAQGIRPDDLYSLLMGVQRLYDYVVIDVGSYLNDNSVTLMDASDRVIVVGTPDLAALRDVSRFMQTSRTLGYAPDKLLIVLNRAGIMGGVEPKEIETVLRHPLDVHIPDDGPNSLRSLNRGIPILMRDSRNPISKAVRKLADMMLNAKVQDTAMGGSSAIISAEQAQRDALMASSHFG